MHLLRLFALVAGLLLATLAPALADPTIDDFCAMAAQFGMPCDGPPPPLQYTADVAFAQPTANVGETVTVLVDIGGSADAQYAFYVDGAYRTSFSGRGQYETSVSFDTAGDHQVSISLLITSTPLSAAQITVSETDPVMVTVVDPAPITLTVGALTGPFYVGGEITIPFVSNDTEPDDVVVDFGDGSPINSVTLQSGGASVLHSYAYAGSYTVSATLQTGSTPATAIAVITVVPPPPAPNLAVTVTPLTTPAAIGAAGSYSIAVTNLGDTVFPGGTADIALTGFSFSGPSVCLAQPSGATCAVGPVASGGTTTFTVDVVAAAETNTLTASLPWDGDVDGTDNSSTITVTIEPAPVDPVDPTADITDQLEARAAMLVDQAASADGRIARLNGVAPTVTPDALVSAFMPAVTGGPVRFAGSLGAIDAATAPDAAAPNLWFDATFGALGGTAEGQFGIARVGIDGLVTPDLLLGLSLGIDRSAISAGGATLEGIGWLLSPYLTARVAPNFYIDLSAGAGLSRNTLGDVEFGGRRVTASGALLGEWTDGPWTVSPELRFSYLSEATDAAAGVAAATVETGRLSAGSSVAYRFTLGETAAEARLAGNAYLDATGADTRADLTLRAGLGFTLPGGANLDLDLTAAGLIDAAPQSIALRAGFSGTLP